MVNNAAINFFNADIEFDLGNLSKIPERLINYINENHRTCGNINYIFCSDDYLLELNNQYLKHDYYTDILSFQMGEEPLEGDIFISVDRVKDNASTMDVPFDEELLRVISHGVLHFMGYKDKTREQKAEMRTKEDELIKILSNFE